ncbi:AAA family ATPase [Aerosakkonema funiforme]|uniref:AAA family ATPase n=1 Tax=Aerosakkonema funiforme TaxID=1246630 RepID=UPI0035BA494F
MLTYIKINGFKSFHNFEMEFTALTVIAGVNASGKSNLFDVLQRKLTLTKVIEYLQTGDPKNAIGALLNRQFV